jgi:hypothetical protein
MSVCLLVWLTVCLPACLSACLLAAHCADQSPLRWLRERTHGSVHLALYLRWAEGEVARLDEAERTRAAAQQRLEAARHAAEQRLETERHAARMGALDLGRHIQGFL